MRVCTCTRGGVCGERLFPHSENCSEVGRPREPTCVAMLVAWHATSLFVLIANSRRRFFVLSWTTCPVFVFNIVNCITTCVFTRLALGRFHRRLSKSVCHARVRLRRLRRCLINTYIYILYERRDSYYPARSYNRGRGATIGDD